MLDESLIRLLAQAKFVSGQDIASTLGVSRAAVWKRIGQLRQLGVPVESLRGQGYRLSPDLSLIDGVALCELVKASSDKPAKLSVKVETSSTNEDAFRYLSDGHEAVVVTAERQTAGKGRRGRVWISPFGSSLYLSVGARHFGEARTLEGLSIAAGLEVLDVLKDFGVGGGNIKWPNDIYFQDRKAGGILIELAGEAGGGYSIVIGVGLNLRLGKETFERIDQPAIDIHSVAGATPDKSELAGLLASRLLRLMASFPERGLLPYCQRWDDVDVCKGREITISIGEKTIIGVGLGIGAAGGLRVRTPDGIMEFFGGEVSIRI